MNRLIQELRQYIEQEGITQVDLAGRSNISQATISRILNGKQSPTIEVVDKLAQVMGRDVSELVYLYLGRDIPTNVYEIAERVAGLSDRAQREADNFLTFLYEQQKADEHQQAVKRET